MGLNVESLVVVSELLSFDSFNNKPGPASYPARGGIVHPMTEFKPVQPSLRERPVRGRCKCACRDPTTAGIGSQPVVGPPSFVSKLNTADAHVADSTSID